MEVEEGGWAGHGVREHAAGVGQQEAAGVRHGAQHGAAGGRPAGRQLCAARTLRASLGECARPASREPSRSRSRSAPPLPLLPLAAWRGAPEQQSRRKALRLAPPCSHPARMLSAREYGQRGSVRETRGRRGWGGAGRGGGGATLAPALPAKSGACASARVRACVAVGGESLDQHQTAPRREGNPGAGTTADPALNPQPARPPAAPALRSPTRFPQQLLLGLGSRGCLPLPLPPVHRPLRREERRLCRCCWRSPVRREPAWGGMAVM